ncbi:hypothetical protein BaRGS_00002066 [Batillaria attramentaria]|uniref:Uncharacterized protein n=1 Tax=Batillaria attramentaria TaxID=370345 RepID=A0ABD0M480_9CAEN
MPPNAFPVTSTTLHCPQRQHATLQCTCFSVPIESETILRFSHHLPLLNAFKMPFQFPVSTTILSQKATRKPQNTFFAVPIGSISLYDASPNHRPLQTEIKMERKHEMACVLRRP